MPVKSISLCVVTMTVIFLMAFTPTCFTQKSYGQTTSSGNMSQNSTGNSGGSSSTSGTYVQQFSFGNTSSATSGTGTSNRSSNNFIGSGSNTGFIGSSSSGTTSNRSTSSRSSYSSSAGRNTSSRSRSGQYGGRSSLNTNTQVQPLYTLGFDAPKRDAGLVSSSIRTRVNRATQNDRLDVLQIELSEGIATVRGAVATEHDRKVAENMILLQPGISEINNEIQIDSTASSFSVSPSVRRTRNNVTGITESTTPQGLPLVHVF